MERRENSRELRRVFLEYSAVYESSEHVKKLRLEEKKELTRLEGKEPVTHTEAGRVTIRNCQNETPHDSWSIM